MAGWALLALLTGAYAWRTDALYAITVYPAWVGGAGVLVLALFARSAGRRAWLPLSLAGVAFVGMFAEEPASLARALLPITPGSDEIVVVTLNTASSPEAAAETFEHKPDLVLIQETPGDEDLARLAPAGWATISGADCAVLAHGRLRQLNNLRDEMEFTMVEWTDRLGRKVDVVSLRLLPPVFRMDYWNPECWAAYAQNRRDRREQLARVFARIRALQTSQELIVGGDFNNPHDPAFFSELTGWMDDAWESGRGWPGTAVNAYPMVRIDRIYCRHFAAIDARVVKTRHSDHRMVVARLAR